MIVGLSVGKETLWLTDLAYLSMTFARTAFEVLAEVATTTTLQSSADRQGPTTGWNTSCKKYSDLLLGSTWWSYSEACGRPTSLIVQVTFGFLEPSAAMVVRETTMGQLAGSPDATVHLARIICSPHEQGRNPAENCDHPILAVIIPNCKEPPGSFLWGGSCTRPEVHSKPPLQKFGRLPCFPS